MEKHKDCEFCKNNKAFEMPDGLVEAFLKGDVVIFAGAGISTENKLIFPITLYTEISEEINRVGDKLPFPEVMSAYETKNCRLDLIEKIQSKFDYIDSFPELYRRATEFHRELATIPMIREIITTNWDEYFEKECDAKPFINEDDIVFINAPVRKVLKIHGSIKNLGSLVITKKDYDKCQRRLNSGLLGSQLKLLLANKTLVFIGYSFADEDFKQIYNFVNKKIGLLSKKRYLVTLEKKDEAFLKKNNLKPIHTAGTFFLHQVRKELSKKYLLLEPEATGVIELFLEKSKEEHNKLTKRTSGGKVPEIFYCQSYQDGIIHAYEYILNKKRDGYAYDLPNIFNKIDVYEKILREKREKNKWWDVAYIRGYQMGLTTISSLCSDYEGLIKPEFYYNIFLDENYSNMILFSKSFKKKKKNKEAIIKELEAIIKKYNISSTDIVFHHTPFLF